MSEAFEAIVVLDPAREAVDRANSLQGYRTAYLSPNVLGVVRVADRSTVFDPRVLNDHALALAERSRASVAVVYDDRVGLEEAVVFREGALCSAFGEQDEIWVPLNDLGEPLPDTEAVRASDIEPTEEYDVLHSAIDLGLRHAEVPVAITCAVLKQQFCYSKVFND